LLIRTSALSQSGAKPPPLFPALLAPTIVGRFDSRIYSSASFSPIHDAIPDPPNTSRPSNSLHSSSPASLHHLSSRAVRRLSDKSDHLSAEWNSARLHTVFTRGLCVWQRILFAPSNPVLSWWESNARKSNKARPTHRSILQPERCHCISQWTWCKFSVGFTAQADV